MAVVLGKSVGLLVGIWDEETQSWFGCRTGDPMSERRAPEPRYEQVLERAPKGGWWSVQIPLVEDEPIEQTVHYILHLQSEYPELCLGVVESDTGEVVRVLSSRMLDDERAAYIPEALETDPRQASSAEVERYRKDRATSHTTHDLPWQEPWAALHRWGYPAPPAQDGRSAASRCAGVPTVRGVFRRLHHHEARVHLC